ncbi:MAG: thiamine-phosphate kinase [Planctomycetota bacterium]
MEADFIAWLRDRLPPHPLLRLGLGDDAALLAVGDTREMVLTVDLISDHVDFDLSRDEPRRIGRKALAVNLSDLAAMAARPWAGVVSLLLPREGAGKLAVELYEGMIPLAEKYGLLIAGGDTNTWPGSLAISITLIGRLSERGPLTRRGARPGDRLLVTGQFGGSILGKHFDFTPRVEEATQLHAHYTLHAGMDVSDGLTLDLARLCDESGVGAVIDLAAVPIAADARRLATERADGVSPLDHALGDGEDFELLLTAPIAEAQRMLNDQPLSAPLTDIGEIIAEPGLWARSDRGREPITPQGWLHEG